MNEQQARNLRADQNAANARRIAADNARVIKGQHEVAQRAIATQARFNAGLRARNSPDENVPHNGIRPGKFILVFLLISIVLFALFGLFVLIVTGLQ